MPEENQNNFQNSSSDSHSEGSVPDEQKPVNPELENVSVNRPRDEADAKSSSEKLPQTPVPIPIPLKKSDPNAPKKIGKEPVKKNKNLRFLLGCSGFLLLLFVLFISLMVLVMSRGGGDNAVIAAFGLAPGAIRGFLLTVINLSFGFLSLLLFALMVIGFFRMAGAKKGDSAARMAGIKMAFFSLIPFVIVLFIWFFLFNFINRLEVTAERVVAKIVVVSPTNLSDLQAPVEMTFNAVNIKKALRQSRLSVASALWDLDGNGEFETPMPADGEVTRLYERRGTYEIGLQVQVVGEAKARVYTLPFVIQNAVFAAEPSTGTAPLAVQFDASGLLPGGLKLQSMDWDFDGDGVYDLTGPDNKWPRFTFEKIGTYNVHLRLIDSSNNVENYYREIPITESDVPLLDAKIDAVPGLKGVVPFSVRFDAGKSTSLKGTVTGYEWDFGDGSGLQTGKSVTHVYNTSGLFNVTLVITEDSGKTDKEIVAVEVQSISSPPKAQIKTVPAIGSSDELSGVLPLKVVFDASKSTDKDNDIIDFEWDFNGDDAVDQQGAKVEHVFDAAGTFLVTLTVRDSTAQVSQSMLMVKVIEPGVLAVINADPEEGSVPLLVTFDGSKSSASNGKVVSYEWDFGDGSPKSITGATLTHKYSTVGVYSVVLKVLTNMSENAEVTKQIFVREIPLSACFESSRHDGAAPLSVTFDPKCSTGSIAKFSWDFGDGVKSSSHKPAHTFEQPGTYTITLEVSDSKNNVSVYTDVIVAAGDVLQ
ncbi:hypothetical protein COY07_04780 [Candidatus Peregrinibacteria bacterium CG_4_10_14_0_2_um_filter_43_11]|nr:MAG: hypothetical protein COY07_04780 [Candidatus Peregrinibacteria bacterium CG_4_10_14_0_2_um_filter_43_11]